MSAAGASRQTVRMCFERDARLPCGRGSIGYGVPRLPPVP
jgi:uncharacterized protein (DUF488 family)